MLGHLGNTDFYLGVRFNFMYQHTEIVKMPGVQGADQKTTFINAIFYLRLKIGFKIF